MRPLHRSPSRVLTAGVAAAALLISACGSDAGGDTSASDGEETSSPLAEYLGLGDVGSDEGQAQFVAMERERQEFVKECMAEQGFEYTPLDPSEYMGTASMGDIEYGTTEWVETYGFGITTLRFTSEQVGPDLIGVDLSALTSPEANPNLAAMDAMSDSEQEAYQEALYGEALDFDESMTDEEMAEDMDNMDFSAMGCEGRSYTEADGAGLNEFFLEFQDELADLEERITSDPRIVEAQNEVSACVAEQGLTYDSEEAFADAVEPELSTMGQEPAAAAVDGAGATAEDPADGTEPAEGAGGAGSDVMEMPELTDTEKARLGELQTQEIELALAIEDCGGGTKLDELRTEVSAEYEQEFLDEHADELEAYAP
ncbi:MAG: hypothetical protein ACK5PP_13925 [Acidimicrobiales bacterium]